MCDPTISFEKNTPDITPDEIAALWRSVGWNWYDDNCGYERTARALSGPQATTFTARNLDGDLVGLLHAISNGFTAYLVYLVVDPSFQGRRIGSSLLAMFDETFADCHRELMATNSSAEFYRQFGYGHDLEYTAMAKWAGEESAPREDTSSCYALPKRVDKSVEKTSSPNNVREFPIVTLCGSTRFKDEFLFAQKMLTLEGNIVISVGLFGHRGDNEAFEPEVARMLDEIHRRKIDMADEVFVVDKHHYIGESTEAEIAYAHERGKPVRYWTDQPWCGMRRDERNELVVDAFAIAENAIIPDNEI